MPKYQKILNLKFLMAALAVTAIFFGNSSQAFEQNTDLVQKNADRALPVSVSDPDQPVSSPVNPSSNMNTGSSIGGSVNGFEGNAPSVTLPTTGLRAMPQIPAGDIPANDQKNQGSGGCMIGGCSGELCIDANAGNQASICLWAEHFACYRNAVCERDSNGQCGWRQTPELNQCLSDKRSAAPNM